jgi:mRNA-degrading endonuclease RelE of RelBE toxin-antitoxin system
MPRPFLTLVLLAIPVVPAQAAPPPTADWPFDVLKLKNGVVHKGLLLDEGSSGIRFKIVGRAPGRPTVTLVVRFAQSEVAKLEKMSDEDRELLTSKLKEIDASPEVEARRLEKLELKRVDWLGKKDAGLRFDSDRFALVSDAPEEVVRRAAYRLENVYAAYARFMPPRFAAGTPTVIYVHQSMTSYLKSVPGGEAIKNPAFYEPSANRIVCGTDLQKLGNDLAGFYADAQKELDRLAEREAKIIENYGKKPDLQRHLQPIKDQRSEILRAARYNDGVFERATRQLFQTLYHEAFHAYVGCFVYPPNGNGRSDSPGELPRWLNEGMAQVFETAVFEGGELRIGHAERARLEKAQDAIRDKAFPPLKEIITARRDAFVVTHAGKRPEADRAYTATWALASYLMFNRQVLGTAELDDFVKATNHGADPLAAFEKLTGQSAAEFDKAFHDWMKRLQPNGSLLEFGGK